MIPRIFPSDAVEFNTNGYGVINSVVECNVVEELNGAYELNMTLLNDDKNIDKVIVGNIISAQPNLTSERQAFVIETIQKDIDGKIEVYAVHISQHRGKLIPVTPFTADGIANALTGLISNSAEPNPFTLSTDKTSSASFTLTTPHTFRELLGGVEGSLRDVYGGDLVFNNFDIQLLTRRGRTNSVRIMYGKNMTTFDLEEGFSWSDSITGVLPFWYNEENGYISGAIQYSPYKDLFKYAKTIPLDCTGVFQEMPTAADLEAYGLSYVTSKGLDAVNISVSYDHMDAFNDVNNIQIGDEVTVINSNYSLNFSSRIVATDFNVLAEQYNGITIGELKTTINEAIEGITGGDIAMGGSSDVGDVAYWGDQSTIGQATTPLYYSAGDSVTIVGQVVCSGLLSTSSQVIFFIPINRPINATGVSFSNLTCTCRSVSGQLSSNFVSGIVATISETSGLRVVVDSSVTLGTAQTPCTIAVSNPTTFTFN